MEEQKCRPLYKGKAGRFQVTLWPRRKRYQGDEDGFRPERVVHSVRACVQFSRYDWRRQAYERQVIWCNPHELRDLATAIDRLAEGDGGEQE